MRFCGERQVAASPGDVWAALHDAGVLRAVLPGCTQLVPATGGTYAATMAARVGPFADTYRGTFSVADDQAGHRLRVRMRARGRLGRVQVDLAVALTEGDRAGTTTVGYTADACVTGVVARLGPGALTPAGNHLTHGFFRHLERTLVSPVPRQLATVG